MRNLILFLTRFRTFGLFLLMEGICAWLVISYNQRQNASFLNSSNALAASISDFSNTTSEYLQLGTVNKQLIEENRKLKDQLLQLSQIAERVDSQDTSFDLLDAKVINSTYQRATNYLTIDAGEQDGVKSGMGVVSKNGVVGQIKSVSNGFATVTSLIHRKLLISSSIKRTNTICTTQWNGESPLYSEVKFVPRHISLQIGDSVVTSGYNSVFPSGILIGIITDLSLKKEDAFYDVTLRLATDFTSLNYVYVIKNDQKAEKDSLEMELEGYGKN